MDKNNIADNNERLLEALDTSISSVDNTESVRLGEGDLSTNVGLHFEDCQNSDNESELDSFHDSSSEFDDTDADEDYNPSGSDSSDSFESNVIYTSTPNKRNVPLFPELQAKQRRLNFQQRSPIHSGDSSPDDPDIPNQDDESFVYVEPPRSSRPPVDIRPPVPPPDWIEVGPDEDYPRLPVMYDELPGPKRMPQPESDPVVYFYLFFTDLLFSSLVRETNRYANQFINKHSDSIKDNSRVREWLPVSVDEMKGFIITILNMGLVRLPAIHSYWSKRACSSQIWFKQMFSRNRFQLILKFFHIVNNDNLSRNQYDPCAKFQPIIDHANYIFKYYYTAHQQISIDESLIGTKSRTTLQQYLPNKQHHRWGIKLWMLCDSVSHYCMAFFVYRGARDLQEKQEMKELGTGHYVVKKLLLMCNYLNKGFHLFTDNFFTSVPLAKYLYSVGTYLTGTIRAYRKELPIQLTKQRFPVGTTKFFKNNYLLLCGSRDKQTQKKQVLLISTSSKSTTTEVTRRVRGQREPEKINKPDMILEYNKYMGGVDTSDMMLYTYTDERKSLKYWKKVVFSVMHRMLLNCYVLYSEHKKANNLKPMTRLDFIQTIIDEIGKEWIAKKNNHNQPPQEPARVNNFGIKRLPGRKLRLCKVCSTQETKHRSAYVCVRCEGGVHPQCLNLHQC